MTDYRIQLETRDGQRIEFTCPEERDVISAGEAAGIFLPSMCKDGGCGACLASCQTGTYHLSGYQESVLPAAARERGEVLLCQTYPRSDLILRAPYAYAQINFVRQCARPAIIQALQPLAERTVRLLLQWQDSANRAVEFEPGQFVMLELPDSGLRRAYSLANTPNWHGEMEFLIRLQPGGQFSNYLQQRAAPGQTLFVHPSAGAFTLHTESVQPAIFVAGGTGLAPFLSMLRRLAEWGEDRVIHLLFGVNHEGELFMTEELARLQTQIPSLSVEICLWKPQGTWSGFVGTPADALPRHLQQLGCACQVYLCGPPILVNAARSIANTQGVPESSIFVENFA